MKYTLITGASSGIGYEMAKVFAKNNHNLILIARSIDKLNSLKDELEKAYNVSVLTYKLDLSDPNFIIEFKEIIKDKDIDNLVNNAGFGDTNEFLDADINKLSKMIDLNIKALHQICYYVGLKMKENKCGKILNVGSAASFVPGPLMATYYGTKSFVLSFSYSLAVEMKKFKVTVSCLCPGPTKTEFAKAADMKHPENFNKVGQSSAFVAKKAYKKMQKGRRIIKCSATTFASAFSARFLPRGLVAKITAKFHKFA